MNGDKIIRGLTLAFIAIALLSLASAGALTCQFRASCLVGEVAVMGYYPATDRAALPTQATPQKLCCSAGFQLGAQCSGEIDEYTSLLRLSSGDNALVEQESMDPNYALANRVCLSSLDENIAVMYRAVNRNWGLGEFCPDEYSCMASIEDTTGARVAPCLTDQYPLKVCATEYTSTTCVPLITMTSLFVPTIYNACCGVSDYICPEYFEVANTPIVCSPPAPNDPDCFEVCDDGIDNDRDGKQDCEDSDCCGHPVCWEYYQSNGLDEDAFNGLCCDDGWDNDGDTLVDYDDPACGIESICDDGLDNDADTLIDCDDPDCCMDAACSTYFSSNEGAAGPNGIIYVCCANGLDEDDDDLIDSADPQCYYEGPDNGVRGTCYDGIDNDRDDLIDCDDPDCCSASNCPTSTNEGANNYMCCTNTLDDDNDDLADSKDPDCANYNGTFNDMVKTGEIETFDVQFRDMSFALGDNILWHFSHNLVDYQGSCLIKEPFSKPDEIPKNGGFKHITDIILMTTQNNYCAVTIHAFDPDGTEVNGSYMLDAGSLPPIDPNAQIPEIPAIIHPVNIYSGDPVDAQDAYNLTKGMVAALLADCGSDCGGNSAAKAKLDDAWRHLKAAERYLAGCKDNQPPLCRFSQYYSERANQLANEGQGLL